MEKRPKGLPKAVLNKKRFVESYPNAKSMTERVGYTPFEKRMASVQLAGEQLAMYRAKEQLFDVTGETDIDKIDWQAVKVRSLGYGLAEYAEHTKAIAKRKVLLLERISEAKAKKAKEAQAARQKASAGGTPADGSGLTGPGGVQGAAHAPASNQ